jgi:hypothetical protein
LVLKGKYFARHGALIVTPFAAAHHLSVKTCRCWSSSNSLAHPGRKLLMLNIDAGRSRASSYHTVLDAEAA